MRFSQIFIKTQRQFPSSEETPGAKLLVKAGFITKLAAGLYSFLPLGLMVLKKIKKTIGTELSKAGVVEILTPILHPAKLWKKSGRFEEIGEELWRIKNQKDEDFVLAMTAEEVFSEIVRSHIQSYKDLPVILNQFQTKIRNEVRPRGGLLRAREFLMQDAYSFDQDEKGLDASHDKIAAAYGRIFDQVGLKTVKVEASSGAMGGSDSFEFMVKNPAGEDNMVICQKCGYAANLEKADCFVAAGAVRNGKVKKKAKVKTPRMATVEEVAEYLKVKEDHILKTIVFKVKGGSAKNLGASGKFILASIRGDLSINQKKLETVVGGQVEIASEKELEAADLIPGFVSPVGADHDEVKVVADSSIKLMSNFIAGANERDYHLENVNLSDFEVDVWADLIQVQPGDRCKKCGGNLAVEKRLSWDILLN